MHAASTFELENIVIQLKPKLKQYLEYQGIHFSGPRQFHCFNKSAHSHEDKNASASITKDSLGFKCFACGVSGDIFSACAHIEGRDLTGKAFIETVEYLAERMGIPFSSKKMPKKQRYIKEKEYVYIDENGLPLYRIDRMVNPYDKKDKQFYPYLYEKEQGAYRAKSGFDQSTPRVLYHLPQVKKAITKKEYLFFVEGEKCAEILIGMGLHATCIQGGAMAWRKPYSSLFTAELLGARLIILPDNDSPGKKFARKVAEDVSAVAEDVKIVELADLPPKGDIEQWLQLGGDVGRLLTLAQNTSSFCREIRRSPFENAVYVNNYAYYRKGKDFDHQITNFILIPRQCIEQKEGVHYFYADAVMENRSFAVEFSSEVFTNKNAFKKAFKNIFLAFRGNDDDLQAIKILMSLGDFEHKQGAAYLGVHDTQEGYVFIAGNKNIQSDGTENEQWVLDAGNRLMQTDILENEEPDIFEIKSIVNSLFKYNTLEKTAAIAGFSSACYLRKQIRQRRLDFPHLSLYGPMGGGKTQTIERVIKPLFGMEHSYSSGNTSRFTQLKLASCSNVLPFILEEYKPAKLSERQRNDISELLRNAYNHISTSRGTPDQKIKQYDLINPIMIAGEEAIEEAAVQERTIELSFSRKDFNGERTGYFDFLAQNRLLVSKLGKKVLLKALCVSSELLYKKYNQFLEDLRKKYQEMLPRPMNNVALCMVGLWHLEQVLYEYNLSFTEVIGYGMEEMTSAIALNVMENTNPENGGGMNSVDRTVDVFDRMAAQEKLNRGTDYEFIVSAKGEEQLALDIKVIYDKFTKYVKEYNLSEEILTVQSAFTKQLRKTEYFACYKNVRFRQINGYKVKRAYVINLAQASEKLDLRCFKEGDEPWERRKEQYKFYKELYAHLY